MLLTKKYLMQILAAVALCGPATMGCSSEAGSGEEAELQQAAPEGVKSNVLGNVVAIRINNPLSEAKVIGSPEKVTKILKATGLSSGMTKPASGALRCRGDYVMQFLDFAGEVIGEADYVCGSGGAAILPDREAMRGTLRVGDKSFLVKANLEAVDAVEESPLVVGDVLWGIDHIEFTQPSGAGEKVAATKRADVKKVLAAMDVEQVPDISAPETRCLPSRVLTFLRGDTKAGFASMNCGDDAEGPVLAQLKNDTVRFGGITVDAGEILSVEKSVRSE